MTHSLTEWQGGTKQIIALSWQFTSDLYPTIFNVDPTKGLQELHYYETTMRHSFPARPLESVPTHFWNPPPITSQF